MKEEYKKTELGCIPKKWKVKMLNDITDVRDGTHDSPKYLDNGIPFITSKNLKEYGIDFSDINYISNEDHKKFSQRSNVNNGDILFGMIGTIGNPVVVKKEFEFSIKNVALIKFNNDNVINNIFLLNILKSSLVKKQFEKLSNGGVQKFIALGMIKNLLIPLPSIDEQEKIADILSTVDSQIDDNDKLIEKTKELKKGLMQRLLTKGIGHTEFKKTEVGEIPVEWDVKKFSDISKINQGLQIAIEDRYKEKSNNRLPYITIQYINDKFNEDNQYYIEDANDSVVCREEDILMTRTGNTGVVVTNEYGVFHNNFFKVDFNREILNKDFLVYYLRTKQIQKLIMSYAGTTTIPDLKHKDFYRIPIVIPPLVEQNKISNILLSVDKQIDEYENKKIKLEELKKGLMQQLLMGKIRVT